MRSTARLLIQREIQLQNIHARLAQKAKLTSFAYAPR